jgi:hypothetical protein
LSNRGDGTQSPEDQDDLLAAKKDWSVEAHSSASRPLVTSTE